MTVAFRAAALARVAARAQTVAAGACASSRSSSGGGGQVQGAANKWWFATASCKSPKHVTSRIGRLMATGKSKLAAAKVKKENKSQHRLTYSRSEIMA